MNSKFWVLICCMIYSDSLTPLEKENELDYRILSGCNSKTKQCLVHKNPGGRWLAFLNTYNRISEQGYYVTINGDCFSSCTYFANYMVLDDPGSICITKNTTFGIHATDSGFVLPYMGYMNSIIEAYGGVPPNDKPVYLGYDILKDIFDTCKTVKAKNNGKAPIEDLERD